MWELGLIKEVVYWFFGWAIIASYEVIKNGEKNNLKRLFIDLINVSAIIALISSFHTFPFLIELILLPVLVIIIGLPLTQRDKTDMRILSIFNFIQGFAGILALFISVIYVFVNYRIFISIHTLRQFTLPILLSVMFLPFLWIFNKYVEYEHRRRFEKLERERKVRLSKIF